MKKLKKIIKILIWLGIVYLIFNFFLIYYVPIRYEYFIDTVSKQQEVEKSLILAVIKTESNFNKDAISPKKAMGLMQIIPETARYVSEKYDKNIDLDSIFDPYTNVLIGTIYLKELKNRFGNDKLAILAYNAGPSAVNRWLEEGLISESRNYFEKIPYQETKKYLDSVMESKERYDKFLQYDYRVPAYINNVVSGLRNKYNQTFKRIKKFVRGIINEL